MVEEILRQRRMVNLVLQMNYQVYICVQCHELVNKIGATSCNRCNVLKPNIGPMEMLPWQCSNAECGLLMEYHWSVCWSCGMPKELHGGPNAPAIEASLPKSISKLPMFNGWLDISAALNMPIPPNFKTYYMKQKKNRKDKKRREKKKPKKKDK